MTGNIDPALFGMPDATTAGVQAGVTLTAYKGPMIITTPGAVIENVVINGTLTIAADNVTIKNCVIQNFDNWGILSDDAVNTRVEYCDIDGSGSTKTTGLGIGGGTNSAIIGCDIRGMVIGINMFGAAEIKDNYIHDLADTSSNPDDRHFDGIRAMTSNAVIEHNTIALPANAGGTAAVFIKTEWGAINNVQVKNNLMTGDPSYTVYVESTTSPITNVTIANNYVERGIYGYFNVVNSSPTLSNNVQWNNATDPTPYPSSVPSQPSGPSTPTAPSAPTIASFSNDTGKAGDGITSDNTLQLKGTAAAGSTVKIYDGSTQIGTTTATASGSWEYITSVLTNAQHVLKATATNATGQTSAGSALLTVTVDNVAPTVPVVKSDSVVDTNKVLISGTAEAGSTIKVYDGASMVGTATVAANGTWSITTSALSTGSHNLTATATDVAGNVSAASPPVAPVIGGPTTPPPTTTPQIVSFSNDSGTAGDNITNDNTLTLRGTAQANATVKVFDGATQIGSVKADANGNWSLTTATLQDGAHSFTVTDGSTTNTAARAAATAAPTELDITIDTKAPTAPALKANSVVDTNHVLLSGTAEAGSTIKVYDGSTVVGTGTAGANGSWSITTSGLSNGTHTLTATATDIAGNASAASQSVKPVIGTTTTPPPAAPKIASFSNDTGVSATDNITNDNTLTLKGTAVANATVKVFDGTTQVGTIKADSSGNWSLTTSALKDGDHHLTATGTDGSGKTSAASAALDVKIDTHAPDAPTMGLYSKGGSAVGGTTSFDDLIVKGTAEAGSKVAIFDGSKQIGTATAGSNGSWSYDTGHLNDGNHSFTAKAIDVAGNTSGASATKGVAVQGDTSPLDVTGFYYWGTGATIKGTADAYSQVKLFDGNKYIGTVKADGDGDWTYKASGISDQTHTFKAQTVDSSGHTTSSGAAILGSSRGNTLTGTTGDDIFIGNGHPDTFQFAANFGKDVIKDFAADGRGHDTIQFSKSVFSDFASVLNHASQVGQDVVISTGDDSLTLKNTKLGSLQSHDFHFA
jgi:Big-like domain-containing protein/parallel beta helix pectate lyase-like protein